MLFLKKEKEDRPTVDHTVNVKYKGTLMSDNSMFDENTDGIELSLNAVTRGMERNRHPFN